MWVRGRAAIALGYEGASLGVADVFADQALARSTERSTAKPTPQPSEATAPPPSTSTRKAGASTTRRVRTSRPRTTPCRSGGSTCSAPCSWPASAKKHAATDAQDQALAELPQWFSIYFVAKVRPRLRRSRVLSGSRGFATWPRTSLLAPRERLVGGRSQTKCSSKKITSFSSAWSQPKRMCVTERNPAYVLTITP